MKAEKKAQKTDSDIHDVENMQPFDGPRVPEGMESPDAPDAKD